MIRIEKFHKSFDGNEVLKGLSLDINTGEVMALIGGSGCGKSVLLKHVAGLMQPDRGRVVIDGKDIGMLRGRGLRALRDRLGFLFQGGALFDSLTVLENVAFPLKEKSKMSDEMVHKKAMEELEHVGLSGSEYKYPSQISGGMVKRAAIARALVMEPEIMLFDGPTTGLDPVRGAAVLDLIDCRRKRLSLTGILVTHETKNVFAIVDRVAMMHDGVIRVEGTPQEIMDSMDPVVRAFVGPPVKAY